MVLPPGYEAEPVMRWPRPMPSAYTDEEIATLIRWIRAGGAFLLVPDPHSREGVE